MENNNSTKKNTVKCPICRKSSIQKFLPFCSLRCSQIDLSKWLNEDYRMSVIETDDFIEEIVITGDTIDSNY